MTADLLVPQHTVIEQPALAPDQLRRRLDPATLPFATTAEVPPLREIVGQPRAIDALAFGLEIGAFGCNLFVAGAPGSGRESSVRSYLEQVVPSRPPPSDWVYVHSFDAPDRPSAVRLPAGQGVAFARAMDEFVATASQRTCSSTQDMSCSSAGSKSDSAFESLSQPMPHRMAEESVV